MYFHCSQTAFLALALTACCSAIPNATPSKSTSTSSAAPTASSCSHLTTYVDTFDNYTVPPAGSEAVPIGYDGGLFYRYWNAAQGNPNGIGVIPASSPNVAVASVNSDLVGGLTTLNTIGVITTAGTSTKFFALESLYYACIQITDNGATSVTPVGCSLVAFGYDVFGKMTEAYSFNYAPTNPTSAPMLYVDFPLQFALLQNVTLAVATGSLVTATTAIFIDNVTHINCS